jgi:hypothetical protein
MNKERLIPLIVATALFMEMKDKRCECWSILEKAVFAFTEIAEVFTSNGKGKLAAQYHHGDDHRSRYPKHRCHDQQRVHHAPPVVIRIMTTATTKAATTKKRSRQKSRHHIDVSGVSCCWGNRSSPKEGNTNCPDPLADARGAKEDILRSGMLCK